MVVLKEHDFQQFLLWGGGCGGVERTDFNSFYLGGCGIVLKELIFNSFFI